MRKLTILFPDEHPIGDLSDILAVAIDFRMETVPNLEPLKRTQKPHVKHHDPETSTVKVLLSHYTPDGIFTKDLASKWLTEKGYAATSASPALSTLRKDEFIVDVAPKRYKWVKRF